MNRNILPGAIVVATLALAAWPAFAQTPVPAQPGMPALATQTRSAMPAAPPAPMVHMTQTYATPASGTRLTEPKSTTATNIVPRDTHSDLAASLPSPNLGPNADPANYLHNAKQELARHRTGAAQQALEMAETRLLDRSVPATDVNQPDRSPAISEVSEALHSLGRNDIPTANQHIDTALSSLNIKI